MIYTYIFAVLLSLYTLHTFIPTSFSEATPNVISKNTKLSFRLIHRHSLFAEDDIRAPVIPKDDGGLFMVNISIGEPPVPQLLAMDTGSHITWVHCTSCSNCRYDIFHPEKSSTYSILSGSSPKCDLNPTNNTAEKCSFWIEYEDQSSFVEGILALEKFTFITSTGGSVEVPEVIFGCAQRVVGRASYFNGILGLSAPGKMPPFAESIGRKFSYCLGSIEDTQYMYNQLILGDEAIIQGDLTPMWRNEGGFYMVFLEGISVGENELVIDDHEFHRGVIIDSGATYTELSKSAYDSLYMEVRNLMDGIPLEPSEGSYNGRSFCYQGDLERDLKGFPTVTLHFREGADIDLDVEGLFKRTHYKSDFCFAILESESNENLLGVVAQQYYNVGFDLDAEEVSFQRIECELLED